MAYLNLQAEKYPQYEIIETKTKSNIPSFKKEQ